MANFMDDWEPEVRKPPPIKGDWVVTLVEPSFELRYAAGRDQRDTRRLYFSHIDASMKFPTQVEAVEAMEECRDYYAEKYPKYYGPKSGAVFDVQFIPEDSALG